MYRIWYPFSGNPGLSHARDSSAETQAKRSSGERMRISGDSYSEPARSGFGQSLQRFPSTSPPCTELVPIPQTHLFVSCLWAWVTHGHRRLYWAVEYGLKSWFCYLLMSCVTSSEGHRQILSLIFRISKMGIIIVVVPISQGLGR